MAHHTSRILSLAVLAAALVACGSDSTGRLTISARLAGAAVAQGGSPALAASALSVAGGRVEIDEVWMVIRDVKLELPGVDSEVNAANRPFLLHVSGAGVASPVTEEFEIEVPAGTYEELRFIVHKLEDLESIGVPQLDGPRASLAIAMTIDGTDSFTFTSELNAAQRIPGRFVVEEGQSPDNVTISIDPAGWFTAGNGSFLDPRVAGNRQAIEDNIRVSIDAFEDDDHNGFDDDGPNHT